MIKSNELRIGNMVMLGNEQRPVEGWMFIQECKNMQPILLTQEILEKCEFKSDGKEGNILKVNEVMFLYWGNLERQIRVCFYNVDYSYVVYHIFYLHQLQNLYFALTGEELPISLETAPH